jgi:hypothetical protein
LQVVEVVQIIQQIKQELVAAEALVDFGLDL